MSQTLFIITILVLQASHIFGSPLQVDVATTESITTTSEPTEASTTSKITEEVTTTTITTIPAITTSPAITKCHYKELQVDCSNTILGGLPVLTDDEMEEQMEIINRRYVPLRSCKELKENGFTKSGLYVVQPGMEGGEFVVYCDMCLLGGGWTIIQRRTNGAIKFDRKYASYKNGFGDFAENFWLGLDKISYLTQTENTELYVGMEAFFGRSTFARYSTFSVGDEKSGYELNISGYIESTAGDSMSSHNGQKFSTYDKDQDAHNSYHCARKYNGGWWYKNCFDSNLNGIYYEKGSNSNVGSADCISWQSWLGENYSLKTTVLAIR